jgi:glycosyltransferase involved in cell wall biosynthesis
MPSPFFSIIIPVHNRPNLLGRTLESVRRQSFSDFEAIIIDDGSTDDTPKVIQGFCSTDSRFRGITQVKSGVSSARNHGIAATVGEWIVFLDSDDLMFDETLEVFKSWIEKHTTADIVAGYTEHIDENDVVVEIPSYSNWNHESSYGMRPRGYEECIRRYGFLPGMYALRRSALGDEIRFDESLTVCEDYDFILRVLKTKSLYRDPRKIHRYRWHTGKTEPDRFSPVRLTLAEKNLREDRESDRYKSDRRIRAEWYHRMADDYYLLCMNRESRAKYLQAIFSNPKKLRDLHLFRQILATFIPTMIRDVIRRTSVPGNTAKT